MNEHKFEIIFSGRRFPSSRIIKADRYEIRKIELLELEEVVFFRDEILVDKESVWDVKEIREVAL